MHTVRRDADVFAHDTNPQDWKAAKLQLAKAIEVQATNRTILATV